MKLYQCSVKLKGAFYLYDFYDIPTRNKKEIGKYLRGHYNLKRGDVQGIYDIKEQ